MWTVRLNHQSLLKHITQLEWVGIMLYSTSSATVHFLSINQDLDSMVYKMKLNIYKLAHGCSHLKPAM